MPPESGEKQHETSESWEEEEGGDDNLERCLKEYEDTLNQSEEPAETKSEEADHEEDSLERCLREYQDTLNQPEEPVEGKTEEQSVVVTDGIEEKVTEAREIGVKSPEDENSTRLTLMGEEHVAEYENQETEDKPTTNKRESTEVPHKEEQRTEADKESRSTNGETQFPKHGEGNLDLAERQGGLRAEIDWNTVRELQQTLGQHEGEPEYNKRNETPLDERLQGDQDRESLVRTKGDTKHQEEEHVSFKLSDNPKAFIDTNRERLVKDGTTLENNEAKLDGKTTLKLNEKEELTIDHGDQHYKITAVEQEKIGEMELNRYKTKQGEEFLHIPTENKLAPPYETPWYALPKTTTIYLEKSYQRELLTEAINKAGGIKALQAELEKIEAHTHRDSLYDYWSGRAKGMFTEKLIPILRYLERDPDEINVQVKAIGKGEAIKNPKLPFRLDNKDGSLLLGARLGDGTLYTPPGRGPRFSYRNNDEEQRNRVAESLTNVFGQVNTKYIHYIDHGWEKSVLTTLPEIIGHTLERAGAITGEVIKQNPDIPTFIKQGTKEMKREYMRQVFGDEGTVNSMMKTAEMSRAVDVTHRLSEERRNRLDTLSKGWQSSEYPDGRKQKYERFSRLPDDIKRAIDIRPRLLESEKRMLSQDFGIEARISPGKIYPREGGYSLVCVLSTAQEDTEEFYREIGFPQERKQEKLASIFEE